jgi:NAD(P)-dependent dehydrogenase (short-subunit alcohol dehydrogenase family)
LTGRHVLITGGSMGIGLAVARALAQRGARLTLVARGADALQAAADELRGDGHRTLALDVGDEQAWRACAAQLGELHGLVCAAAVLGPIGAPGTYAPADFRRTIEVNLLGTLLAVHHCLPALRASRGAIVTFSGGGATAPLPRYDAYAASKAAVVRLSENMAVDLHDVGVRVNCVAPGFVATRMHRDTLAAGAELAGADYYERTRSELESGGVSPDEAAELVCLLLGPEEEVPFAGKLISAQWDPWRDSDYRARLAKDRDLATLRRIDQTQFAAVSQETPR